MDRGTEIIAGLVALLLVPWLVWTMRRGLREGRLPIARAYVRRDERSGPFHMLLALYMVALGLVAFIAADLLLDLGFRSGR